MSGAVYALDADTGKIAWETDLGTPVSTSVMASPEGLYAATADASIYRLDPRRGTLRGSRKLQAGGGLRPRGTPVATSGDSQLAPGLMTPLTLSTNAFGTVVSASTAIV